jgi:hypothetical protein
MNDQEMRMRALELAVRYRDQLMREGFQIATAPGAIFDVADQMFNYVWSGDHPDENSAPE